MRQIVDTEKDDPGFWAGVMYACGLLAQDRSDGQAEFVFSESGMSHKDVKTCAEYDVAFLRRLFPRLPKGR